MRNYTFLHGSKLVVWNVGRPAKKLRISSDNDIPWFKQNLLYHLNIETPGPNWKRLSENLSQIVLPIYSAVKLAP